MNILILSWRGPGHPSAGGAEQSTWHHATGWALAGHTVTLLTASYLGAQPKEFKDGVNILRYGDQFIGVRVAAFFWYWFGKHKTVDLVVDEFHGIPFFTPLWVLKSKILGFIHEVAQPVWMLNPWSWPFNLIPSTIGRYGEPWMFKLLYRNVPFMTVSESTKKDLEIFGVKNVTVVHNGVSLSPGIVKSPKEKNFTIIYLSAIARDKGIDDALQAFEIIKSKIPEAVFWVVGKGNPDHIENLKNKYPDVRFWGFVSEQEKFELLARAHVLLFPSVHEGWGLVIIEAASVGTPTVAYSVSGVRDAIIDSKTGLLAKAREPEGLVDSLMQLYNDKKLYSKLSNECKIYSKNFEWNKSIELSTNLIRGI